MARVKVYMSEKWLRKKYLVERLTEEEMAKEARTTQTTINRWLRHYNLKVKRR